MSKTYKMQNNISSKGFYAKQTRPNMYLLCTNKTSRNYFPYKTKLVPIGFHREKKSLVLNADKEYRK